MESPVITSHISNVKLKTVMPDWKGTPLDQQGLFINYEFPTVIDFRAVIKFMLQRNPQREIKKQDTWRIEVLKDDAWLRSQNDAR
jgi:hypothetical protein